LSDDEEIDEKIPKLTKIEKLIHQPARLRIMSYLYIVNKADMVFLKNQTGLTWGNLSSHMSKLENKGLVKIEKKFKNKKPLTILQLTNQGKNAFESYRKKMTHMLGDLN
jgi:DNA-binding MarR family transcriptional regulator